MSERNITVGTGADPIYLRLLARGTRITRVRLALVEAAVELEKLNAENERLKTELYEERERVRRLESRIASLLYVATGPVRDARELRELRAENERLRDAVATHEERESLTEERIVAARAAHWGGVTLAPLPSAAKQEEARANLRGLSKSEAIKVLSDAGILTPDGKLSPKYI